MVVVESGVRGARMIVVSRSFDDFYAIEFRNAARLAHLLTGQRDLAEDLAQDGMTRLLGHYDGLDNPAAYLNTIMVNLCRTWHRSVTREEARLMRFKPSEGTFDAEFTDVLTIVDGLPYRQRAVLVLRYWLDLSEDQIASHLGCRNGTVKSLSARALGRLREELGDDVR